MIIRFLFYSIFSLLKLIGPKLKSYDDHQHSLT
jgi:hypothetical protein